MSVENCELPTNRTSRKKKIAVTSDQLENMVMHTIDYEVGEIEKLLDSNASIFSKLKDEEKVQLSFNGKKYWYYKKMNILIGGCKEIRKDTAVEEVRKVINGNSSGKFLFDIPTFEEMEKIFKDKNFYKEISAKNTDDCWLVSQNGVHCEMDCSRGYCSSSYGGAFRKFIIKKIFVIPIYHVNSITDLERLISWLHRGLIPESLEDKEAWSQFVAAFPKIKGYIQFVDSASGAVSKAENIEINFNKAQFKEDIRTGKFKDKIFGHDLDYAQRVKKIKSGAQVSDNVIGSIRELLLNCDKKRADITPYDEKILTDVGRGHWELFEEAEKEDIGLCLTEDAVLYARPPHMDVHTNATCAIDFGTKSTIVVCRDGEARMLRVGKGDYSKKPSMKDFENPTAVQFRDLEGFLASYRKRAGRPYTEWNQVTVSHQAMDAIISNQNFPESSIYNSVFAELKQWAKDEENWPVIRDLKGKVREIKPYLKTKAMDDGENGGDIDPIELYAYYLGLYINNMHRHIYLDYILSFPVNYKKDVRERIRESFERGIKKSLPPALLKDKEIMKRFRVYLGASEPAAYAISAMEGFKLEPKQPGEQVAYGVFDFGGGTTDFDFGVEYVPEKEKRNFIIEQFGFNGDVLLGGENILELLAYEVYKDNLKEMHEKNIPFALPAGCDTFAGAEALVMTNQDAAAHMNKRILAEKLRPLWEKTDENGEKKKTIEGDANRVTLYTNKTKEKGDATEDVKIRVDVGKLEGVIRNRINQGVENFFQSMNDAFKDKLKERKIEKIHIFLAGNSCRSPIVKELFDKYIGEEEKKLAAANPKKDVKDRYILHLPLGMESENEKSQGNPPKDKTQAMEARGEVDQEKENIQGNEQTQDEQEWNMALDMQRTGKTGVAFGLLRCRRGGKDVKIINHNTDESGEILFPYYLGYGDASGYKFDVQIGLGVEYGDWAQFTSADEPEFELYYTSEPRAKQLGELALSQVSMVRCPLDEKEVSGDPEVAVFIRKVKPNMIEYAVGKKSDFEEEFKGRVHQQVL